MRVSNVVFESLLYIHELLVLYFSGKVENLVRITPAVDRVQWTSISISNTCINQCILYGLCAKL